MRALRLRLRHWVALWLVLQTTSLAALVPRDCCKAHRPDPRDRPDAPACHKNVATAHTDNTPKCNMRATCQGPMAILASLMPTHGIVPDAPALEPHLPTGFVGTVVIETPLRRINSPDTPPPRA
jgi:hypothetical protein